MRTLQAREHFTNRLQNHGLEVANDRARHVRCERICAEFGVVLEPELTRKTIRELESDSECQVEQTEDDNRYLVQYAKRPSAVQPR
jgi:hypothetical protein